MQFLLLFILIMFLSCRVLQASSPGAKDESKGIQSPILMLVKSSSHIAIPKGAANDKCSEALEWSEATGTLTAKITVGELSNTGVAEGAPSVDRTFFIPFPTVKLDHQKYLVIDGTFQKTLILGRLEERPLGTFHVVLRSDIHLQSRLEDGTLTASLVLASPIAKT